MIELRTLGVLELHGTDGRELRSILQQPKRLALLAYLALAGSRRFHRRDSLLTVFWPEHDAERARAVLRRSIHFLRQSLGAGVIVGRGDEEVAIDQTALTTDVARFDAAIADDRLSDALELYRGELLRGVFIRGAPEFEHWLDAERTRLRDRAAAAAWTLASRLAQSEPALASHWARQAAGLTPHDEPAHRRLLGILHGAGDRVAALKAHEEFAARLRADYEMEPSDETTALVRHVRTTTLMSPQTPAAPIAMVAVAPSSAGGSNVLRPEESARVIAVLPFTVRGNRDLSYLAEGMVDLLSTTLDAAGDLRTVDPRALLGHLHRETTEGGLDLHSASACANRFAAGMFVLGSIVEAGGRMRIVASLYETRTATLRASADVSGGGESGIFDMVDEISRLLLARESDRPHGRLTRLGAMTTVVLPALKAYLRGECEFRAGRYFQALEHFQNAAAEDTGFALAYYRLSASAAAVANLPFAREAIAQALLHREKLAEHDRLLLEAQDAWLRGAADEAESLYRTVVATHVDDVEAWFLLGDVLFHHNPLRGRSITEAREPFEHALQFDPDHVSALVHLARLAALERRDEELNRLVDRILALSPAGDRALSARALRAFTLRDPQEKAGVVAALGRARALAVGIAFTDIIVYARDRSSARQLAELFTRLTRGDEDRLLCHLILAHLALADGDPRGAAEQLERAERLGRAWALECRGLFAVLPFREVSEHELRQVRAQLADWDPAATPAARNAVLSAHNEVHGALRHYLIGLLSARLGDASVAEQAAESLGSLASERMPRGFADALGRSVRCQVARGCHRPAEALAILEGISTDIWYQLSFLSPFYSLAFERFMRADLLATLGRKAEARPWLEGLGQSSPFELIYVEAVRRLAGSDS